MIETVLSLGRRDRGEIPFVLDAGGELHTVDPDAARTVSALTSTKRPARPSTPRRPSWRATGSSSRGATRRASSSAWRAPSASRCARCGSASLRSLAVGLLLIAGAFAIILPLASRLTRHLTRAQRRASSGWRRATGPRGWTSNTADEVGELAQSFNRMASELESHDRLLVKQERLARELELCRQIQNEMLPHGPLKLGLAEIAGVSIPAREVGGDFFNYFPLADGRIAVLVGDVSGKGVGAALLMANIQATLRARLQLESDLAHLADSVDRDIAANTPPEVYITLFVGLLDPPRRELHYVNAGHNPQFLLRADGGIERLGSTGLPIGLLPGRGLRSAHRRCRARRPAVPLHGWRRRGAERGGRLLRRRPAPAGARRRVGGRHRRGPGERRARPSAGSGARPIRPTTRRCWPCASASGPRPL